jgi:glycosyltransferase involved in cell wall biosynthesis
MADPAREPRIVDVVVVAGDDAEAALACVDAVLASRTAIAFDVWVVLGEDAARRLEASASPCLGEGRVHLVAAASSLAGAVDDVRTGHGDRDLVVLDAGARVLPDWLDRLAAHAASPATGVVGTFTDARGTAVYARPRWDRVLPADAVTLDERFSAANRGRHARVDAIEGPCRWFTRECLRALGIAGGAACVPEQSGDLAERAMAAGFRCIVAGDVYVARDDASASSTTSASALDGPLAALARRVDLARIAASPRPAIVFVSHGWGGGVRRHLDDLGEIASERADVLHLEPAGAGRVRLAWPRVGEKELVAFDLPEDFEALASTLRALGVVRLHYHHVHRLPREVLDLPATLGVPYDCTLHDYYAICPQYHLADERGRYCGEPDAAGCAACLAKRPPQWDVDIAAWRALFAPFLAQAQRVIAPSDDVATRIRRYFPSLSLVVWSHPERAESESAPPTVRVMTLGNLSPEKGLDVVAACARDARERRLPLAFRVLGATARPLPHWPDAPLSVHGSYADAELPELIAAERPDVLFFPVQVPETYSYTLSVALACGLPIVASSLGAFGERLAGRANARTLPFDAPPAAWNDLLLEARRAGAPPVDSRTPPRPPLRAAS